MVSISKVTNSCQYAYKFIAMFTNLVMINFLKRTFLVSFIGNREKWSFSMLFLIYYTLLVNYLKLIYSAALIILTAKLYRKDMQKKS